VSRPTSTYLLISNIRPS